MSFDQPLKHTFVLPHPTVNFLTKRKNEWRHFACQNEHEQGKKCANIKTRFMQMREHDWDKKEFWEWTSWCYVCKKITSHIEILPPKKK